MYPRQLAAFTITLVLAAFAASSACAQGTTPAADEPGGKKLTPIVFVHGISGAGEQFERQALLFASNGYPTSWIVAFDYSTDGALGGRGRGGARGSRGDAAAAAPAAPQPANAAPVGDAVIPALDKFIDEVRKRTGHDKVDLVGHSFGTRQSTTYLSDPARAAKVAHYAAMAGFPVNNQGGVPSIGVGSVGDYIAGRGGPSASNGAKAVRVPDFQDHVMACTSDDAFKAVYEFFNDKPPAKMKVEPQTAPQLSGFVKTSVQNNPLSAATVDVWEVAKETGRRTADKLAFSLKTNDGGAWGPFTAKPNQYYEFVIKHPSLSLPKHVFREPFSHTDQLVYFRVTAAGPAPAPVEKFFSDTTSMFNVRHQNGALLPGVMSLKINGTEVCSDELTPASGTVVVLYVVDGNSNGKTDLTRVQDSAFSGGFTSSVDMHIPAEPSGKVEFKLGNRVLNVPSRKSKDVGSVQVVFDDYQ